MHISRKILEVPKCWNSFHIINTQVCSEAHLLLPVLLGTSQNQLPQAEGDSEVSNALQICSDLMAFCSLTPLPMLLYSFWYDVLPSFLFKFLLKFLFKYWNWNFPNLSHCVLHLFVLLYRTILSNFEKLASNHYHWIHPASSLSSKVSGSLSIVFSEHHLHSKTDKW